MQTGIKKRRSPCHWKSSNSLPSESIKLSIADMNVSVAVADQEDSGLVAVAYESGQVSVLRHDYNIDFSDGVEQRKIIPSFKFPYGRELRAPMPDGGITDLALSDNESELVIAAAGTSGRVRIEWGTKKSSSSLSGK